MDDTTLTYMKWMVAMLLMIGGGIIVAYAPLDPVQRLILGVSVFLFMILLLIGEIKISRYV